MQQLEGVFVQEEVAMAAVMSMGRVFFNMAAGYPKPGRVSNGFARGTGKLLSGIVRNPREPFFVWP
jgi:hypothetical protein